MQGKCNLDENPNATETYITYFQVENTRNNAQSTKGTISTQEEQVENTSGEQTKIVEEQLDLS